jgi:hypothetical protein
MNGNGYYAHQGETVVGSFRIPISAARSKVSAGLLVYVIVGAEMQSRENTIATEVPLKRWAAYQAAIEQCLAARHHLHEQRVRDQEAINRLRVETKALLAAWQAACAKAMFKQLYASPDSWSR